MMQMKLSSFQKVFLVFKYKNVIVRLVTICPNGQHSMALIDEMYPELENVDLGFVYTGVGSQAEENKTVRLDFESFQPAFCKEEKIKILP